MQISSFGPRFFIFEEFVLGREETKSARVTCKTTGKGSFGTSPKDFISGHRSSELGRKVYFPFLLTSTVPPN